LPIPISRSISPVFSSGSFKVLGLTLRSLMQFELIFVHGERQGSGFSLLHVDTQFFPHHLLKRLSFSSVCFWHLCQEPDGYTCVGFFLGLLFCTIGLRLFLCQYSCFCYCVILSL
jgi:hypothetical protein